MYSQLFINTFFVMTLDYNYQLLLFFLSILFCSIAFVFFLNRSSSDLRRKIRYCINTYPSIHFFGSLPTMTVIFFSLLPISFVLFCSIAFVFCLNRSPSGVRLKISYCTTNYSSIHFSSWIWTIITNCFSSSYQFCFDLLLSSQY